MDSTYNNTKKKVKSEMNLWFKIDNIVKFMNVKINKY